MNLYSILPIKFQNQIISIVGSKRKSERILNDEFVRWATFLNCSKDWSKRKLREFQRTKLSKYLFKAYCESEFWNTEMQKITVSPKKAIIDDPFEFLTKLPKIDKKIVLANKKAFLNSNQSKKQYVMVHTSGTTGAGFVFPWSLKAIAAEYAFVWFRRYHSVLFGDKHATFNGNKIVPYKQKKPPFWRENKALNQTLFSIFHLSKDYLDAYINNLKNNKFVFFNGYPSAMTEIANYLIKKDIEININSIYPSSESLYDWQRELLKVAFNSDIYDSYTNAEQSVLIYQDKNFNYQLSHEYSFVEFETKKVMPNNAINSTIAHIVGTNYLNDSIFLIRYQTHDYVELDSENNQSKKIKKIIGRQDDLIYTIDKRPIGRLDHLFKESEDLQAAQIIQRDYGYLEINYILRGKQFVSKTKIEKEVKERLGKETSVFFKEVKNLKKDASGKIRGVINRIENQK